MNVTVEIGVDGNIPDTFLSLPCGRSLVADPSLACGLDGIFFRALARSITGASRSTRDPRSHHGLDCSLCCTEAYFSRNNPTSPTFDGAESPSHGCASSWARVNICAALVSAPLTKTSGTNGLDGATPAASPPRIRRSAHDSRRSCSSLRSELRRRTPRAKSPARRLHPGYPPSSNCIPSRAVSAARQRVTLSRCQFLQNVLAPAPRHGTHLVSTQSFLDAGCHSVLRVIQ